MWKGQVERITLSIVVSNLILKQKKISFHNYFNIFKNKPKEE